MLYCFICILFLGLVLVRSIGLSGVLWLYFIFVLEFFFLPSRVLVIGLWVMIIFYFCPWIFFLPLVCDYFLFLPNIFFLSSEYIFCPLIKNLFYEYYFFSWCICIIFYLFYFLCIVKFFFSPFGCLGVGGCPSPRACWAYPRTGPGLT